MTAIPDGTSTQPPSPGTFQGPPTARPAAQDRLAVHLIWEGILLVTAVALVIAALVTTSGAHLADIVRPVGYAGLIASGLALSLRTGSPNLAVGYIAAAAGAFGAHLATADGWSLWIAMTLAVILAAVAGLIAGLVTAALSVPAWAVTLGMAILIQSAAFGFAGDSAFSLNTPGSYPSAQWLGVFVVVSVGGGALWLIPSVQTRLSMVRDAAEPGQRAGLSAGLGTVVGLTGSSLLAGAGGVAMTIYAGAANLASGADILTIMSLGAVLIGGVSIFGRRAGLLGTVFGVVITQAIVFILDAHISKNGLSQAWVDLPIGGLVLLGLCLGRGLESVNDALDRQRTGRATWQATGPG